MPKGVVVRVRIRLEPALEERTALMNAAQCRALARVYARWARQLRVKAKILELDRQPVRRPPLRPLPARRLALN